MLEPIKICGRKTKWSQPAHFQPKCVIIKRRTVTDMPFAPGLLPDPEGKKFVFCFSS